VSNCTGMLPKKIGSRPQRSTEQCHFTGLDRRVAGEGVIQLGYIEGRRAAVNHSNHCNSNVVVVVVVVVVVDGC